MKKGQIDDSRNPLKPCEISNLELFSRKVKLNNFLAIL